MAQIVWTEPALADLQAIGEFIAVENPAAARALVRRVVEHVEQLGDHPESGGRPPELKRSRYRQLVEPPCRVFYRYDEVVLVLHVMRTEQVLRPARLRATASSASPAPKAKGRSPSKKR